MSDLKELIPILQSLSGDAKTAFIVYVVAHALENLIVFSMLFGTLTYGIHKWYSATTKEEQLRDIKRQIRNIYYEEARAPTSHASAITKFYGLGEI